MLEQGLVGLLREKGVAPDQVKQRAQDLIRRSRQWQWPISGRKAICSQADPPFQIILPSELERQVEARARSGAPTGPKRKQRGKQVQASVDGPPKLLLPSPELVEVPNGLFVCGGRPLPQLQAHQIGPGARGVVLMTAGEAQPYLFLAKAVSSCGLNLLVIGGWRFQVPLSPIPR